jgi:opacity protein-like surface antigen
MYKPDYARLSTEKSRLACIPEKIVSTTAGKQESQSRASYTGLKGEIPAASAGTKELEQASMVDIMTRNVPTRLTHRKERLMCKKLFVLAIVIIMGADAASAMTGGLGGGLGATMPRGQFNKYTDNSFTIMGFGKLGVPSMPYLGVRFGLQGVFLERDEYDTRVGVFELTQKHSSDLWKGTMGLELAPRMVSLEPYIGGGVGLYNFRTKATLETEFGEEVDSKTLESETEFGWNLTGGLRLYFTPKIAMDVSLQYDKINNMRHLKAVGAADDPMLEAEELNSEILSIFAGIHVTLP